MNAPAVRRALVVVAHPDDAEIAAGGTIAALAQAGTDVTTMVLSLPEEGAGRPERRSATQHAARTLGYTLRWLADGEHRQVSELSETTLVGLLDLMFAQFPPDLVLTHWDGDSHVDHVLTTRAVTAASRKSTCDVYQFRPGELRTAAFSRFQPSAWVDIGAFHERKRRALRPFTIDRPGFRAVDLDAIDRTDRFYGALAACDRAEGFHVVRQRNLGFQIGDCR